MDELNHEEVKTLIPSYVLGAVAPEETTAIRAHILACEECMAEADSYAEVAGSLALAVDEVPLPAGFEDRVLAQVVGERHEVPKRRRTWGLVPVMSGLALVMAMAILATTLIATRDNLDEAEQRLAQAERVVTELLHSDSGMQLQGPSGAVGRMLPSSDGGTLVVAGLPEAPRNHAYQLWLLDDGVPQGANVFDVSEGVAVIDVGESLEGIEGVAVTIEPEAGSTEPTGEPVLSSA